jgi:ribosomal-protein-alanine N-acetyltransferase
MIALAPERLATHRLDCRRLGPQHARELTPLMLDPRVVATLWPWPHPPRAADIRAGVDAKAAHWERHGFGMWLVRDRRAGELIGRGGLQYCDTLGLDAVEVGWTIAPPRWGRGLATELALASVAVAFDVLELSEIIAFTQPDNLGSRRVMEKAGFAHERDFEHLGLPHVLYRRSRW